MGGKKLAIPGAASASGDGAKKTNVRLPAVESPMKDAGFLRAIIDQDPSPVFVVNVKSRELELANEAAGKYREGSSCNSLLYGGCVGSPPSNKCLIPELLKSRRPVESTHHMCDPDGRVVTKKLVCVPVFDDGELTHAIHYFRERASTSDKEVQAQALSDLRAQKEMAQMYLDIASVVLVSLDRHGRISMLNRAGGELLGCEPKNALGMDWFDNFIPPAEREKVREVFAHLIAGDAENAGAFENPIISLDGKKKLIAWRNALLKDNEGKIIGTISSGEDITERRTAEHALRESESRFRELADQLPQTIFEANLSGRLIFANSNAFNLYGYTLEEFKQGISIFDMLEGPDKERAREVITSVVLRGRPSSGNEYVARKKDGSTIPVVIYSAPMFKDNTIVGIRGIVVDISERKKLEAEYLRNEKMASVAMLAGGIAHDFNNMLTPIVAGLALSEHIVGDLAINPDDRKELVGLLSEAATASRKASRLTKRLMNLSQGDPPQKATSSLAELVRETTEVVLSGSNVGVNFQIPDHPIPSEIDKTQIDQVVTNIVTNAKQAMVEGGRIHISAEEIRIRKTTKMPLSPGRYIHLSFRDEGPGIPEDVLPKIFEPYFTTKGEDGTGLGLATSFNIIKQHGGHLAVESPQNAGATFHMYLPISSEAIEPEPEQKKSIVPGHGRILVMDDERYIRDLSTRVLGKLGYECDCASDGEEAVKKYSDAMDSGNPYSLVILDLTVKAGLGGIKTLEILKEIDPDVKAIASSGYAEGTGPRPLTEQGFSASLPKPYSVPELSKTIHKLIKGG